MVEAVEEFHRFGYVLRNLSPDSFRIMKNRVVIIDFSFASFYFENSKHKNREHYAFKGTHSFASTRSIQGYT